MATRGTNRRCQSSGLWETLAAGSLAALFVLAAPESELSAELYRPCWKKPDGILVCPPVASDDWTGDSTIIWNDTPANGDTADVGVVNDGRAQLESARLFSGPTLFPPKEFAAYGVVAFRATATDYDRERHRFICAAYVASLPHTSDLNVPHNQQIVTVWPADTDQHAQQMNDKPAYPVCESAVAQYGLWIARKAIDDAEKAGAILAGTGPYLLAWAPSTTKGEADTLVLVADLSDVTTYDQALDVFLRWTEDIERDPSLWKDGWDIAKVQAKIRIWVDTFGPKILEIFGTS